MKRPFIHEAETIQDVLSVLSIAGENARVVAGGTAFTILRKAGLLQPEHVVDLKKVKHLNRCDIADGWLSLGALCTLTEIALSELVKQYAPVLASTSQKVANRRVRNMATIGGNVSEADPTSDPPGVLAALGAEIRVANLAGERRIPYSDFAEDYFQTSLRPDEVVTDVEVPVIMASWGGTYVKFLSRTAEDRTCIGIAAFTDVDPSGLIRGIRLAVTGVGPVPVRVPSAEDDVIGRPLDEQTVDYLIEKYVSASDPISDVRGSVEYREAVMSALIPDALRRASNYENCVTIV